MSFAEMLPSVGSLSRADKLRLMDWLAHELAQESPASLIEPDHAYPLWSPDTSFQAAATMLEGLKADQGE